MGLGSQHASSCWTIYSNGSDLNGFWISDVVGARLRGRIGEGGRALYHQHFSEAAIAARLDECIAGLARDE